MWWSGVRRQTPSENAAASQTLSHLPRMRTYIVPRTLRQRRSPRSLSPCSQATVCHNQALLTKDLGGIRSPQVHLRTSSARSDDPATRNTRASVGSTGPDAVAHSRRLPILAVPPARTLTQIAHPGCPSEFHGRNHQIKRTMVTRLLLPGPYLFSRLASSAGTRASASHSAPRNVYAH